MGFERIKNAMVVKSKKHERILFISIVVLFILINSVYYYLFGFIEPKSGDQLFYYSSAKSLISGQGFTYDGAPVVTFPIGYPLLVAAVLFVTGGQVFAVTFVQIIISFLTMLLMIKVAGIYIKNNFLKYVPALLYVLNYKIMSYNSFIMSEALSVFLVVALVYLLGNYLKHGSLKFVVLLSLTLGWLTIIKPAFQYIIVLLLLLLLVMVIRKRKVKYLFALLVSLLIFTAILYPVFKRGHDLHGGYKIVFQGGGVLYGGTFVQEHGLRAVRIDDFILTELDEQHNFIPDDLYQKIRYKKLNEKDNILMQEAIKNIIKNGIDGVPLYVKNFRRIMTAHPYERSFAQLPFQIRLYFFYGALCLLLFIISLISLFARKMYKDVFISSLIILTLYNMIFHFLIGYDPRYGFPTYSLVYIVIPLGLYYLFYNKITNTENP